MRKCELAAKLALPLRTLSYWQKHASEPARVRGPKPRLATPEQRAAVVATLIKLGPQTGLPTLRAQHPTTAITSRRAAACLACHPRGRAR